MGNTNIDSLIKIKLTGKRNAQGKREFDIIGKESTAEAEAPFVLEINGKKAKLYSKFGVCQPEERTLDQWLCALLNGSILNGSIPTTVEDMVSLSHVCEVANCIFPVNASSYEAVPLLARLQIVMGMADWVTDLNVGIRYHNDRDQFYDKMQEIMPDWTASDVTDYRIVDSLDLEGRFHEYASSCQRNNVDYSKLTFTKRWMFNSVSDLAMHLLIYFVEHNWTLQRCPVCKKYFRSPSLKRETCSEDCKRANERRKKKNWPDIEKKYKSAKSNLDRKYYLLKKREGLYVGRDSLKEEFAELFELDKAARESFSLGGVYFDDEHLNDIREWLKKKRLKLKQAARSQKQEGETDTIISSYEEFVQKFRELLSALKYDAEYDTKDYYKEKKKML